MAEGAATTTAPVGNAAAEATPAARTGRSAGTSAPAVPAPAVPAVERRVCSILFADLVGFTPLSESRDAEEVRGILSRYFDVARTVIGRYGGTVEKFIGDAVMAVWGAPLADEDDTERAVRAALDLVAAVGILGAEVGAEGLSARAGVVTGEVAVNLGVTGEGMVAGDAVNTASRVQSVALPGSVFVDDTTKALSDRAIAFADAGIRELKGKASGLQLHRVVRVLSGVGGSQRPDGLEAPLAGRDAELRTLKELFHASVERRTPRLVLVTGPAGVGKSRLAFEFYTYIDGLVDTVLWHKGRCLSYGEGVAFWALSEIVRQRFGIAEEDPVAAGTQKLAEGLVRFVANEGERDYIGARLSRLLGVDYQGAGRAVLGSDELFAGWRLFFERLAEVAPVVLLVEDAQHADPGLLEFLAHLVDWTRDLPIFVLVFARPGLEAIDSGYGSGRNRSTLSLDPLDSSSMTALLSSLVPALPKSASDAITAHAQGIPLYAVETVRSLIDGGVVERQGDTYHLAGDLGTLQVPESLHALLAARLDALPAGARAVVADASVLGSSFPKAALMAVCDQDEAFAEDGLAQLVRRDVLEISADPLSPERGQYRFSQEMLRQVAYQTLSKRDRQVRHLAVAAHLRETFANDGEEVTDVIAHHYLDAIAAGGGGQQDVARQAVIFLVRAGERSERAGAPATAAASYAEAASAETDGQPAADLLVRASDLSHRAGEDLGEKAVEYAENARRLYLAGGDTRGAARAATTAARGMIRSGRFEEARQNLVEALDVLQAEPDRATVEALRSLADLECFSGHGDVADRLASKALTLGQALGVDRGELSMAFGSRGLAYSFSTRPAEAAACYRESARLAESFGDFGRQGIALGNLADEICAFEPRQAAEAAEQAAALARRAGHAGAFFSTTGNLVLALLELGEWDRAGDVIRDALDEVTAARAQTPVTGRAVTLLALRGSGELALSELDRLASLATSENVEQLSVYECQQAIVNAALGRAAQAMAHARLVLSHVESAGIGNESVRWALPVAARAARSLGDAQVLAELAELLDSHPVGHLAPVLRAYRKLLKAFDETSLDKEAANGSFAEAVAAFREVDNPYELAHALVDHAGYLAATGNADAAVAGLAEARAIAARLGCPPLEERATQVEAALVSTS